MKKQEKTNVMRILEQKKIAYKSYLYSDTDAISGVEVANVLGEDVNQVFKTLVTIGATKANYVFMIPVHIIAKLFIGVNHIPLIGPLNEVLGGMIGAAQGMLYMFVIASVVWFVLSASGGQIGPVTVDVVEDTILFKEFYNIGPWVESTAVSL